MEVARPALESLRDESGESVQLYVREGNQRVCVAAVERAGGGLRDMVPVGSVLPLDQGSGGRVLLAWSGDEGATEFKEVRRRGWAESVAERESGVASVSAPVFGRGGGLQAAVCVSGPVSRLGEKPGERLARDGNCGVPGYRGEFGIGRLSKVTAMTIRFAEPEDVEPAISVWRSTNVTRRNRRPVSRSTRKECGSLWTSPIHSCSSLTMAMR